VQERTDHAVVLIGCLGNAGHGVSAETHCAELHKPVSEAYGAHEAFRNAGQYPR